MHAVNDRLNTAGKTLFGMEYQEASRYLESLQRRRPNFGTETTERMLSYLGAPHESLDCVQIGGSNGKGSTARMLERILRMDGKRVGLYTSPELNDVRERIRVDGRKVSKKQIAEFVEAIDPYLEDLPDDKMPTYFEVLTAFAFDHFDRSDIDIAVLEVGIGGRYDSTSVIDPVASAITTVSLEHTDLLGDTIKEIARDKAHISPSRRPLVTGATGTALETIEERTDVVTVGSEGCDVVAIETGMASDTESTVSITAPEWAVETGCPLLGRHQAINAGIASTLARQLGTVDIDAIANGLRSAHCPGRFEIVDTDPMVVLDGAHNPEACAALDDLLNRYEYTDLHVVFGAMADKDHRRMAAALPEIDSAYLCRSNTDRAQTPTALKEAFERRVTTVSTVGSVLEAAERAISSANEGDVVLVTGSLSVVAEARDRWTRLVTPKRLNHKPVQSAFGSSPSKYDSTTIDAAAVDFDHRTIETRLRQRQAELVEETMDAVGGTSVRSGEPGPLVSLLLSGTMTQFDAIISRLSDTELGLAQFTAQLDTALRSTRSSSNDWTDSTRTALMGILNVTPDSFYDGGEYDRPDAALERAREMIKSGADIIDIGGESTRPGADPVSVDDEIDRVVPIIERLSGLDVPISIDTRKAAVADAALDAGADIVNDVSGLEDPDMRFVVAEHDAWLVLMHSLETPVDPDRTVQYDDVIDDVLEELTERLLLAERAGIDRDRIIVDPGIGFGKTAEQSFELIDRVSELRALGCQLLVGHSQKSLFERVDCGSAERLPPTLAVSTMAAERGVDIVRVHEVTENAAVLRTATEADEWYR